MASSNDQTYHAPCFAICPLPLFQAMLMTWGNFVSVWHERVIEMDEENVDRKFVENFKRISNRQKVESYKKLKPKTPKKWKTDIDDIFKFPFKFSSFTFLFCVRTEKKVFKKQEPQYEKFWVWIFFTLKTVLSI